MFMVSINTYCISMCYELKDWEWYSVYFMAQKLKTLSGKQKLLLAHLKGCDKSNLSERDGSMFAEVSFIV